MIDLGTAHRVAAGAIGEPGDRTFFIEVATASAVHRFLVEKLQVAALAMQVDELLGDAGVSEDAAGPALPSEEPQPSFRVGEIRITPSGDGYRVELHPTSGTEAEPVSFSVAASTLASMTGPAMAAVRAGRPLCPRCGLAMDPDGHPCPVGNGDLRQHRP